MLDVKNKKVLVVGLGVSGYAAAELLARRGARVRITESSDNDRIREYSEKLSGYRVKTELGAHTAKFCAGADLVVISPGIDRRYLSIVLCGNKAVPVIGELELAYHFCKAPIIAVTGTNGKSTTTALVGKIISLSGRHAVVCGNIGNPLSAEVDLLESDSVAVVEVSSFQLETIKDFRPWIAVLLNVSEDHYERHNTRENYKKEKFKIFKNQSGTDWAVLSSDLRNDPMVERINAKLCFFEGTSSKGGVCYNTAAAGGKGVLISRDKISIKGDHNISNVACSVLVAGIMGIQDECIIEGVTSFRGLRHRFEEIGCFKGVKYIDDSKATNIDATHRALKSLNRKVVLIAGGRDKGGDYAGVLAVVKEKVKSMVLIGEAAGKMKEAFSSVIPVHFARDMPEAVKRASCLTDKGEAVLLSPMCSSFDMFSSYRERGEAFQWEVRKLKPDPGFQTKQEEAGA